MKDVNGSILTDRMEEWMIESDEGMIKWAFEWIVMKKEKKDVNFYFLNDPGDLNLPDIKSQADFGWSFGAQV